MSTTGKAANRSQGGYADLGTYDWASTGRIPDNPADAVYSPYGEPIADLDNGWNYQTREDLKRLNYGLGQVQADVSSLQGDSNTLRSDVDQLRTDFDTHDHDSRYYRQYEADFNFVSTDGDTMTGGLRIEPPDGPDDRDASFELHPKGSGEGRFAFYRNGSSHWEIGSGDLYDVDGDNRLVVRDLQTHTSEIAIRHGSQIDVNSSLNVTSGDATVGGISANLGLGEGAGPHSITFGNDTADHMSLAFRTGRQAAVFEDDYGNPIFAVGLDGAVDASNSDYIQFPVRSSTLSTAPDGAAYIID